jgi:hypothetical protein
MLIVTFVAAIDRIGAARDDDARPRLEQANRVCLAQEALEEAKTKAEVADTAAGAECRSG